MRTREEVKLAIEAALRLAFPTDTVDVSDGYENNIHVLVVSRRFDSMANQEQLDLLWGLIDGAGLNAEETALISLVLPASPGQLK